MVSALVCCGREAPRHGSRGGITGWRIMCLKQTSGVRPAHSSSATGAPGLRLLRPASLATGICGSTPYIWDAARNADCTMLPRCRRWLNVSTRCPRGSSARAVWFSRPASTWPGNHPPQGIRALCRPGARACSARTVAGPGVWHRRAHAVRGGGRASDRRHRADAGPREATSRLVKGHIYDRPLELSDLPPASYAAIFMINVFSHLVDRA